jgi:hypothetical protein
MYIHFEARSRDIVSAEKAKKNEKETFLLTFDISSPMEHRDKA